MEWVDLHIGGLRRVGNSWEHQGEECSSQEGWPEWTNYREDQAWVSSDTDRNGARGYSRSSLKAEELEAQKWAFVLSGSTKSLHARLKGVYRARGELDYMNIVFQKQMLVQKWISLVKNGILTRLEVKEAIVLAKMKSHLLILEGLISTVQGTGLWSESGGMRSRPSSTTQTGFSLFHVKFWVWDEWDVNKRELPAGDTVAIFSFSCAYPVQRHLLCCFFFFFKTNLSDIFPSSTRSPVPSSQHAGITHGLITRYFRFLKTETTKTSIV